MNQDEKRYDIGNFDSYFRAFVEFALADEDHGAALREHFEAIRREVLDANASDGSDEVSRRLINRLLHEPSNMLRDGAVSDNQDAERAARRLFGLGRAAIAGTA